MHSSGLVRLAKKHYPGLPCTACHVQNANTLTDAIKDYLNVNDGETTPDGEFTLESVACLGCCSLAPVMMVGDNTYGKLNGKSAVRIIKDLKKSALPCRGRRKKPKKTNSQCKKTKVIVGLGSCGIAAGASKNIQPPGRDFG